MYLNVVVEGGTRASFPYEQQELVCYRTSVNDGFNGDERQGTRNRRNPSVHTCLLHLLLPMPPLYNRATDCTTDGSVIVSSDTT